MQIREGQLPGLKVIIPQVFSDSRGFFLETYQLQRYQQAGIEQPFVQDNYSRSTKGVLRGLHFQPQKPSGKTGKGCGGQGV